MSKRRFLFYSRLGVMTLVLSSALRPAAAVAGETSADDIVERVTKAYAALRTYRDEITVSSKALGGTAQARISVAFIAPEAIFVNVLAGTGYRRVHVHDRAASGSWSPKAGWEKSEDLSLILAGIKGTGALLGGAGYWTTSLLFPDLTSGYSIDKMTNVHRLSDARFDGVPCYALEGELHGDRIKLWVGRKDFLVRRIEVTGPHDSAAMNHKPEANAAVDIGKMAKAATAVE